MKRKLFAVLLITSMLALAACGKTESTAESTEESVTASTAEESAGEQSVSDNETTEETSVSDNAVLDEKTFDYSVLPAFSAVDLDGNTVTNDLIAGKDITMVNVWGTFCSPCIAEMPDLAKLAESLPDNAQLIGFICDVTYQNPGDAESAVSIVEKAGVTFTNIILDENLLMFTGQFQYVPTTFFVDSEGNVLGDPIIGADMDSYVARLGELLEGWTYEG